MKGNFYLNHTGPLRIFTEKEMMLEKAAWATPGPWGHFSTALHQHLDEGGGCHLLIKEETEIHKWNDLIASLTAYVRKLGMTPATLIPSLASGPRSLPLMKQYLL